MRAIRGFFLLLLSVVFELLMVVAIWPFVALDNRHGWTVRARRQRAWEALRKVPAVSIAEGPGAGRAVFEGTLEAAGPLVRVPFVEREALAWCAWAMDGSLIRFIDGEITAIDLVDDTGRLRLRLVGACDVPYGLGETAPIAEVPEAWRARGGTTVDGWTLGWVPARIPARASGKVMPAPPSEAPYREAAPLLALGPGDDGVPVLLGTAPQTSVT